jgi:uncharacterized membrane protein YedE/YeeE
MGYIEGRMLEALLGGILIGVAAALLMLCNGRIAGVSGILGRALAPSSGDVAWRWMFLTGLIGGGFLLRVIAPASLPGRTFGSIGWIIGAGVLVGVGTAMGNGCTSGHGVCGIGRLSLRSLIATGVFMLAGIATVAVIRHGLGGFR